MLLSIDVTPQHLLLELMSPWWGLLREIKTQWSHGARVGTVYCYSDSDNVLHMHFAERGSNLERRGALKEVPTGHFPSWELHPAANIMDSRANAAAEALVSLPATVDPNDPRWDQIRALAEEMDL